MNQQAAMESYLSYLNVDTEKIMTENQIILEGANLDKLARITQLQIKKIENELKKLKFNLNDIKANAKKCADKLKQLHASGKTPEETSKIISKEIAKAAKREFVKRKQQIVELEAGDKVLVAIVAFYVIVFFNGMIGAIVASIVSNPMVAMYITVAVVAPMVEEAAKTFFIKQGMPWVGTGIVFGFEFAQYVMMLAGGGVMSLGKAIIVRLTALAMHFGTTIVQKKIIEAGEEVGEDRAFAAWLTGVGIHALWNTFALILNDKI